MLYIATNDDGTDRDAMGRYYFRLAKENGINIKQVKIIDMMSFKKESGKVKGKVLGWAFCE